jgi:phasin family protein
MAGSNQQSSESAMQAMEWMRNMADQLVNHSKTMWESSFTTARHAFEEVEQQASEIRGRLLSLTEATLANSFEFAQKVVQARGPQELLQLESEFISRQAQLITEQSKRLSESAMRGAQEVGRMASQRVEEPRRRAAHAAC